NKENLEIKFLIHSLIILPKQRNLSKNKENLEIKFLIHSLIILPKQRNLSKKSPISKLVRRILNSRYLYKYYCIMF
ncbi:hypothetical protein BpHYR1_029404, partial [Brachionus plicatilis]